MRQIVDGIFSGIDSGLSRWRGFEQRWWYVGGLLLLSIVVTGPRQWLIEVASGLEAVYNLPRDWWGQWIFVLLAFILILWGVYRAGSKASNERELQRSERAQIKELIESNNATMARLLVLDDCEKERDFANQQIQQIDAALTRFSDTALELESEKIGYRKFMDNLLVQMDRAIEGAASPAITVRNVSDDLGQKALYEQGGPLYSRCYHLEAKDRGAFAARLLQLSSMLDDWKARRSGIENEISSIRERIQEHTDLLDVKSHVFNGYRSDDSIRKYAQKFPRQD